MTPSVIVKIMKHFFAATNEDNETFVSTHWLLTKMEEIRFCNTIPVIQPVEAIFRLASPWYSDHKVCAKCHVSKEKQQEHVSHVSTCRHNNYVLLFTLIEYH